MVNNSRFHRNDGVRVDEDGVFYWICTNGFNGTDVKERWFNFGNKNL